MVLLLEPTAEQFGSSASLLELLPLLQALHATNNTINNSSLVNLPKGMYFPWVFFKNGLREQLFLMLELIILWPNLFLFVKTKSAFLL